MRKPLSPFLISLALPVFAFSFLLGSGTTTAARPSPQVTPSPIPSPASTPTVESLQGYIRSRLFSPDVLRSRIGMKIVSLSTGKVVFENDAEKYFMPASNMKNFTVAAALEKLGPDFRFVTSVYAGTMPDGGGTIRGD